RDRARLIAQRHLVAEARLQHRHRVEELLARAPELAQRRVRRPVPGVALELLEESTRVRHALPRALEVARERPELRRPHAVVVLRLLLRLRLEVRGVLARERRDRAR